MDAKRRLRFVSRLGAGVVGLAAAGYSTWVVMTWLRYGRVAPPASGEDGDALLDQFMPTYEIAERHHVRVAAPAGITFAAAAEMGLTESVVVRGIFKARELIMRSRPTEQSTTEHFISQMLAIGWGVLAEVPDREIVMGAVTQPWLADVVFRSLPPAEFVAFQEPGYVKIVWTLRADPAGDADSVFRTETRAVTTDPTSRAKFRRYWSLASPGIVLIRWLLLGPVKAEAERRARVTNQGQQDAGFPTVTATASMSQPTG